MLPYGRQSIIESDIEAVAEVLRDLGDYGRAVALHEENLREYRQRGHRHGELVSLRDERCPEDVRKALQARGPNSTVLGTQNAMFTQSEKQL